MRIHLHDVLSFILPVIAAHALEGEQTVDSTAHTTDIAPLPVIVPPSQYCKLMSRLVVARHSLLTQL